MPLIEAYPAQPRRILFLDAYDSFTNNIVSLLKDALGEDVIVHVLHMDLQTLQPSTTPAWTREEFATRLADFDAVVCGPGPGSPLCEADVGVFRHLWGLPRERAVPVLGICLGFQSLVAHFGGGVRKLRCGGLHGMVRGIEHRGGDIFRGVGGFRATLYHSLGVDVGQDDISSGASPSSSSSASASSASASSAPAATSASLEDDRLWLPPAVAPELIPLAWTVEGDERILMAARHARLPLWGVQYHPESVCTDPEAQLVLRNWFAQAMKWNEAMGRRKTDGRGYPDSLGASRGSGPRKKWWWDMQQGLAAEDARHHVIERLTLPDGVDAADVAEVFGLGRGDSVLLDSSSTVSGDPLARNSIIALGLDDAMRIEYHVGDDYVTFVRRQERQVVPIQGGPGEAWAVVSEFWRRRHLQQQQQQEDLPAFSGGFMGFVTYEMGLGGLSPDAIREERGHRRPDLCLVWVARSIVLDHQAGVAYVQTLAASEADGRAWVDRAAHKLRESTAWKPTEHVQQQHQGRDRSRVCITTPDASKYEDDVRSCQAAIREGHSYELCLTGQTTMTRPRGDDVPEYLADQEKDVAASPWKIFRTLRTRQPAPFGSFVRLGGATIVSSSPERFLSHDAQGLCSMRPMKGTVRKSDAVKTLEQAERLLHVPKEEAENLMIVDLVRHDLHGVCGVGRVAVPDLLKVEEYASVYQMVTVVTGRLPGKSDERFKGGNGPTYSGSNMDGPDNSGHKMNGLGVNGYHLNGLDVLSAALPPGSMTGAPKKRSCELLRAIEGETERSIYSGVVGYMDVHGRGDWSVTIRTMFRWDDEIEQGGEGEEGREGREVWRIGAGGAVTTLSTAEGERDEMFTKLSGPLSVFMDVA